MANHRNNPDADFQLKIDRAFPENGIVTISTEGNEKLTQFVQAARSYALELKATIPHSRERSLAFSRLEECFVWALLGMVRGSNGD